MKLETDTDLKPKRSNSAFSFGPQCTSLRSFARVVDSPSLRLFYHETCVRIAVRETGDGREQAAFLLRPPGSDLVHARSVLQIT
eukprot:3778325-Amphidinium_carterae.1